MSYNHKYLPALLAVGILYLMFLVKNVSLLCRFFHLLFQYYYILTFPDFGWPFFQLIAAIGLLFSEIVDRFPKRLTFDVRSNPSAACHAVEMLGGKTGAFWGANSDRAQCPVWVKVSAGGINHRVFGGTARNYLFFSNKHPQPAGFSSINFVTDHAADVLARV